MDSRTDAKTVAYDMAERAGVPAASRKVFLDDVASRDAILKQLDLAARDAQRDGFTIAIGHPRPPRSRRSPKASRRSKLAASIWYLHRSSCTNVRKCGASSCTKDFRLTEYAVRFARAHDKRERAPTC